MADTNIRVEAFVERLARLENALQTVKCQLHNFYEHISAVTMKKALHKVVECIPPVALALSRKSNEPPGPVTEDPVKMDALIEKYLNKSKFDKKTGISRQPVRYAIFQNYAQPEAVKVAKVTLKSAKASDMSEGNQDHTNTRPVQMQIANSGRIIQKSLQILTALENAARCLGKMPNEALLKEEIVLLVKQLRVNIATLAQTLSQLNRQRQITRILARLRQRATVKKLLAKMEDEKGKKKFWRL